MHYNCLIVDDETDLARMTAEYFRAFGLSCEYVDGKESCFAFFKENTADLILLDINLGDGSGFDVCRKLREDMQLPILFISARQSDDDVLIALTIGGDDYVKKPYSLSVLLAKVKIILKRLEQMKQPYGAAAAQPAETPGSGASEDFKLEPATMSVMVEGRRVDLKAKEYALLDCLYRHKNAIVKKEDLFDEVWGDTFFSDSTLNVHIRRLREKIEEDPKNPKYIKTVWGTGYYLKL
ncbi:MAG: response regulator transcription factor [Lachnospiraceae bacterium]|nr:response regulator transcription factor [Lachnospiraceae bacterium]